jgi:N-acetylglutamate synthase-like GNAT family acetyltransferase
MKIVDYGLPMQQRVVDLILSIQVEEFGFDLAAEDQPDLFDVRGVYQTGAGGFWLAMVGDDLAGTIALHDLGQGRAALRKMFVKPAWRGREHGVAAALLAQLLAHARAQGLREIVLGTTDRFLAAHRFYEKNGFVRIEPEALPPGFKRMPVDTRFYRLALD